MPGTRFTCILTLADEPACAEVARVTITDTTGDRARGCCFSGPDQLCGREHGMAHP